MNLKWNKLLAFLIVSSFVITALAVPFWVKSQEPKPMLVHARMAEDGGWIPGNFKVQAGEPLTLRLTSDDVQHSFAVGQLNQEPVDVNPGEITEVTLQFDEPGKYTFYCTRWCGANHWRMRGVIDVGDETATEVPGSPLYVELGLNIDAPHLAQSLPAGEPSAEEGILAITNFPGKDLPERINSQEYYRSTSPAGIWQNLRSDPNLTEFNDQQLWNVVAAIIQNQISPAMLQDGKRIYSQNCAACHGEKGAGDGVFADELSAQGLAASMEDDNHSTVRPANLANPESMLGASPALLQGKIERGGMGTGMPYWGPIFTEAQTWALVAYIQSFILELENEP